MEKRERIPKKRRRLTIWRVFLLLLLIGAVAFAIFRLRLKWQLNARIEAIRAAGYPVTCEELDSWYTIPEDAENAAFTILDAFSFYHQWDKIDLEGLPLVGRAELPARIEPMASEMKALVTEYVADNNEAINLLHAGAKIEHCRYPVDYSAGFQTELPSLSDIRQGCRLLNLEALLYAENGQAALSIDSVLSGYGLARSLAKEPMFIGQLVRLACEGLTTSTLERVVNKVQLTDEQLIALSEHLRLVESASDMSPAFVGERCMGLNFFTNPASLGSDEKIVAAARPILALFQAVGLVDMDAAIFLDMMNDYMEAARLPHHEQQKVMDALDARLSSLSKIHILALQVIPALLRINMIELRAIAKLRVARAGLAVQRYRLATGAIPDTLSQLVPAYLDVVPKDPFDGNELRYKKREAGFVIYSINEDLSDDGGAEKPKKQRGKPTPNWDVTFIVER
ncbi:hypothetical protein ACFL5Z_10185 [Planctomycetota bacterium]